MQTLAGSMFDASDSVCPYVLHLVDSVGHALLCPTYPLPLSASSSLGFSKLWEEGSNGDLEILLWLSVSNCEINKLHWDCNLDPGSISFNLQSNVFILGTSFSKDWKCTYLSFVSYVYTDKILLGIYHSFFPWWIWIFLLSHHICYSISAFILCFTWSCNM